MAALASDFSVVAVAADVIVFGAVDADAEVVALGLDEDWGGVVQAMASSVADGFEGDEFGVVASGHVVETSFMVGKAGGGGRFDLPLSLLLIGDDFDGDFVGDEIRGDNKDGEGGSGTCVMSGISAVGGRCDIAVVMMVSLNGSKSYWNGRWVVLFQSYLFTGLNCKQVEVCSLRQG